MMAAVRVSIVILFLVDLLVAQPRIGQTAPALHLGAVISGAQSGPSTGHALFIEFWATWCIPCRTSIPHLNQLADRFQNRGIDFLSLTSEPAETVKRFLSEYPIQGIVALDPAAANYAAFAPFDGLPTSVLIDSSGNLAAVVHPSVVTSEVVEALLAHRPLPLAATDARIVRRSPLLSGATINDEDAAARVVIRPTNRIGADFREEDRYETGGSSLASLLNAWDVPEIRIEMPAYLSNERYAVQAWVPPRHPETLRPLVMAAVEAGANIRVRREERLTDVLVLAGFPGKLRVSSAPLSQASFARPGDISCDCTAEEFARYLEMAVGKTVVPEGPPSQRFLFKVGWDPARSANLASALATQLGLRLESGKRPVPFLIVDSLDALLQSASPR